jgi:hypothetical protein
VAAAAVAAAVAAAAVAASAAVTAHAASAAVAPADQQGQRIVRAVPCESCVWRMTCSNGETYRNGV